MGRLDDLAATRAAYDLGRVEGKRVFLAGSSRHSSLFLAIESILQLEHGKLVSACCFDGTLHKDRYSSGEWEILQQVALEKLQDQDVMLVIDIDGHVGEHTRQEIIHFSSVLGRPVLHLGTLAKHG